MNIASRTSKSIRVLRLSVAYSKFIRYLFLIFAAYLVLPLVEVPLMGLSISAPVFFLIALTTIFRPPEPWFFRYRGWIFLACLVWVGIFLSFIVNGLFYGELSLLGIQTVIRYAYWSLTFIITIYFVSRTGIGGKIADLVGWMILILALFRWGEALLFGRIGAWTNVQLMSQNSYGIQFSSFTPFLYPMVFSSGKKRVFGILAVLTVWGAALINGSRSSWIALAAGFVLYWLMIFISHPKKTIGSVFGLLLISALAVAGLTFLPENFQAAINSRYSTLNNLEEDKSYAIRQLMVQKGLRLFQESPLVGVGAGNFRAVSVDLDIPKILTYASQDYFDEKSAHNSYILFLSETGLAGSIPLGLLLIFLVLRGWKVSLHASYQAIFWIPAAYAAFVSMSIHLWTLAGLTGTAPWVIYGLLGAGIVTRQMAVTKLKTVRR